MHRARLFLAILLTAAAGSTPAVARATVFSYTGGEQSYTVPAGVSSLSITATGAPGGGPLSGGLAAGRAAVVSGIVTVAPGQVVYVEVGGSGGFPAGGFNGGGDSPTLNGLSVYGGGGASDVRTLPMSAGVISLNSRLIVAAGGGGGLYGGGGGGGVLDGAVGGGGGGSSLVPSDLGTMSLASLTTAPMVQITPVPPPSCQDVTSNTPYGQAAIVQLMCTEFAGRALTYAIVGAPAHGTLSAVGATGQVTYTPTRLSHASD